MAELIQTRIRFDEHIDPDTLATFAGKALSEAEEGWVFEHLAECGRCRDLMSAHSELRAFEWSDPNAPPRAPAAFTKVWKAAGLGFAAAALVFLFARDHRGIRDLEITRSLSREMASVLRELPRAEPEKLMKSQRTLGQHGVAPSQSRNVRFARSFEAERSAPKLLYRRRRETPVAKASYPRILPRRTDLHLFEFPTDKSLSQRQASLPGPLASARLPYQTSFLQVSRSQAGEVTGTPLGRIALQTSLGERQIYISVFGSLAGAVVQDR